MRVLITGATGFIGSYLARFMSQKGHEVWGTFYDSSPSGTLEAGSGIYLLPCDIRDAQAVDYIVGRVKPERIYHLAAQSSPTLSWKEPTLTMETNVTGTINLFQAVLKHSPDTRVLVACSSAEYGYVPQNLLPIKEDCALRPLHPYGVSKVAQDLLAYQYFVNFKVHTLRLRIFNTTGPGKSNDVCSDFAWRIAAILAHRSPPVMKVGNLQAKRDIMDVRDAIEGIYLAMEQGEPGEVYNLCTSKVYQISELLEAILPRAGTKVDIQVAAELLRPSDEAIIWGDNSKLCKKMGWKPQIPMDKTLGDTLDYWQDRMAKGQEH